LVEAVRDEDELVGAGIIIDAVIVFIERIAAAVPYENLGRGE